MKKSIVIVLVLALCVCALGAAGRPDQKDTAHQIAELARSLNLPEDDPIIKRAQELWWEADAQEDVERDIIATVVYNEAWGGCSDRHRELVAAVVCNRVASETFPDTVYEVVTQNGQYHPAYADPGSFYGQRARADANAWAECRRIAEKALRGEVECPENVLYQANFPQGSGTYEIHRTSYSVTYFCYG